MANALYKLKPCCVSSPLSFPTIFNIYNPRPPETLKPLNSKPCNRCPRPLLCLISPLLQRRLDKAVPWAEKYVAQFTSPLLSIVARFVSFVCSSMLAVLITLWLINEQMMKLDFLFLGIHRNLYWYMGVIAMSLGVARSCISHGSHAHEAPRMLKQCASYTTHLPRSWQEAGLASPSVRCSFSELFMYNVGVPWLQRSVFLQEVMGVIVTPFFLLFVLPDKAEDMLVFLRHNTVDKPAVNSIINYADFSSSGFSKHAAREQTANNGVPPAAHRHGAAGAAPSLADAVHAQRMLQREKAQGRFEKSFVGFKANHPTWQPPEEGQAFLCKLMQARFDPRP